ncbi:hypothetical protein M422DRAFT_38087, partial [Sphaerobolus stellatus SS14]
MEARMPSSLPVLSHPIPPQPSFFLPIPPRFNIAIRPCCRAHQMHERTMQQSLPRSFAI